MKAFVSLSGGMDSATVLQLALDMGREVEAVSFYYGSKHNRYENEAAKAIADHCRIPFRLIDWSSIAQGFHSNLMQDGGEIPEGHYQATNMSLTVVPARNLIFASILAGIAWSERAGEVWLGIHAGDHAIYPDCRPGFFNAMSLAVDMGTDGNVSLRAPFLYDTKFGILEYGSKHGVQYQLTRTCYKDQPIACGKCGACQERLEAFAQRGLKDPIEYEV